MQFLELFRDALATWWLRRSAIRKLRDIGIAVLIAILLLFGDLIWGARDALRNSVINWVTGDVPVLDIEQAGREAAPLFRTLSPHGALALYVVRIDVTQNRRGVVAHAAAPEEASRAAQIAAERADLPFIDQHTPFEPAALAAIFDGQPYWSMTPDGRRRFLVSIPPALGRPRKGVVVVLVRPDATEAQQREIQRTTMRWAESLSR